MSEVARALLVESLTTLSAKWREAAREWEADGGQSWKVETYFDCADQLDQALADAARLDPQEHKCSDCGAAMNDGEAKVFTCCEACWDKHYHPAASRVPETPPPDKAWRVTEKGDIADANGAIVAFNAFPSASASSAASAASTSSPLPSPAEAPLLEATIAEMERGAAHLATSWGESHSAARVLRVYANKLRQGVTGDKPACAQGDPGALASPLPSPKEEMGLSGYLMNGPQAAPSPEKKE